MDNKFTDFKQARNARRKHMLIVGVIFTVFAFVLLFFIRFADDFSFENQADTTDNRAPSQLEKSDNEGSTGDGIKSRSSAEANQVGLSSVKSHTYPDDIQTNIDANDNKVSQSVLQSKLDSAEFKKELAKFEEHWNSLSQHASLLQWAVQYQNVQYNEVLQMYDQALAMFTQGDYTSGKELLTQALQKIKNIRFLWNKTYDDAFLSAQQNFQSRNYKQAVEAIDYALTTNPQSQEALVLQQRIKNLPKIQDLQHQIVKARDNDDIKLEHSLLKALSNLDPEIDGIQIKIQKLHQQIIEEKYQRFIKQGTNALQKQDVAEAVKLYEKARMIGANRIETENLHQKINTFLKDRDIDEKLKKIEQFIENDHWINAKEVSQDALTRYGSDERFIKFDEIITTLLSAFSQIGRYDIDHERLTDFKIRSKAQKTHDQLLHLNVLSLSLSKRLERLQSLIKSYDANVNITVISDNETYVKVVGVGHVGVIDEKQITLKPGTYILEGSKKKYKTVRKTIKIDIEMDHLSVTVICDEPV